MWISRNEHYNLRDDLWAEIRILKARLENVERYVEPYVEHSKTEKEWRIGNFGDSYDPRPICSISLWEMIHAIRKHLGLEISEVKAPKEKWQLIKKTKP